MHDYTKLAVWDAARRVALAVYSATEALPKDERFGLVSPMRRASVSVASNIAEGAARSAKRDFARFLRMASGSAGELDTQIRIAAGVGHIGETHSSDLLAEITQVRNMLHSLQRKIREAAD